MPVELLKFLLGVAVVLLINTMVCLAVIFADHPFVPKAMLKAYFKPPYFSHGEIAASTGFPIGYMRTAMFLRLAGFPSSGKRRGLTEAYLLAPPWFRVFSRIFIPVLLANFIPLLCFVIPLNFFIRI